MGLNETLARNTALIAEITGAVAAAKDGTASRREIFSRFADRASKATIYRHIDAAIASTGATLAPTKLPPRPGATMSEAEQEKELSELMPSVEEIERLAAGEVVPAAEPISRAVVEQARSDPAHDLVADPSGEVVTVDVGAGMVRALGRAEALMDMAEHADGSGIRNARLMVVAIDLYGKTAERKARVDADLSDSSQQGAYLRAITNAVLAEPADVKARILARMRGVNAQWGM
jgi:hypothetical protein